MFIFLKTVCDRNEIFPSFYICQGRWFSVLSSKCWMGVLHVIKRSRWLSKACYLKIFDLDEEWGSKRSTPQLLCP